MKKEVKEKWVAALRSGEYKQCQERLFVPKYTTAVDIAELVNKLPLK